MIFAKAKTPIFGLLGSIFAAIALPTVAQETPLPSAAPISPLSWKRAVPLHDGRTLVSDGAIALDAELVKPASKPSQALGEAGVKIIEGQLSAELPDEFAFSDLTRRGNFYAAPNGLTLSPIYIDYLRRTLPEARLRLRMKGLMEPVVIVFDGKAVGLLMPIKAPNPQP